MGVDIIILFGRIRHNRDDNIMNRVKSWLLDEYGFCYPRPRYWVVTVYGLFTVGILAMHFRWI